MEHKTTIKGFTDLKELATAIGDLRYDALYEFLDHLSDKLYNDSVADQERGRQKLADHLWDGSTDLWNAVESIKLAWEVSKPYMNL